MTTYTNTNTNTKTKISDLDLSIDTKKKENRCYVIQSLRFDNQKPADDFKLLCKRLNLRTNQAVFEYMIRCTNYVLDELAAKSKTKSNTN